MTRASTTSGDVPRPGGDGTGGEERGTSRRRFLTYLVAAPTLVVAGQWVAAESGAVPSAAAAIPTPPGPAELVDLGDLLNIAMLPTANLITLSIGEDGVARFALHRAEVGQGISTTVAMIIAEELDLPLDRVEVTLADSRPELVFNQLTGGSSSVRTIYDPVRRLAATARARMLETASAVSGVPAGLLSISDGVVSSADGSYTGTFAGLAAAAAGTLTGIASGNTAAPKDPADYRLLGTPQTRQDARAIVTGAKKYTSDLDVPGALPVFVRRAPTIGGTPRSVDNEAEVRAVPGVVDIAVIPTGVAVVAETFGQALDGLNALRVTWNPGPVDGQSDETIRRELRAISLPLTVPPLLSQTVEAEFDWAFASHAPMETNHAVADVRSDRAEIWGSFKTPIIAQQAIAIALGLPQDRVVVHCVDAGGSFGRHLFYDAPLEAALVSRATGRPVKLMWTRADDVRHGRAAPATHHKVRATVVLGQVATFEHRVASVETDTRHGLGEVFSATAASLPAPLNAGNYSVAQSLFLTAIASPYDFGVTTQLLNETPLRFNTASFRSVYSYKTRGVEEVLVDEIAARLGQDPVAFRRATLKDERFRAVLDRVATEGRWGRRMAPGTAQGVAVHAEYTSCTACLVEIDTTGTRQITVHRPDGTATGTRTVPAPRVTRATIAVDVGRALNPRGLQAQMIGGLTDAISLVLRAGLHVVDGRILEGSYSEFHYARQDETPPEVDVIVMPPTGEPGGAGELGLPAAVGAVVNAYARATGTRPRRFPIAFDIDFPPRPASLSPQPPYKA